MQEKSTNLIVDAGNTLVKVVEVQGDEVRGLEVYNLVDLKPEQIKKKIKSFSKRILSSVLSTKDTELLVKLFQPTLVLEGDISQPFTNLYLSNSLGADRKANAAFAAYQARLRNDNILVIDIGSCIKFDFVNVHGEYLGGSISPGLRMRYKSMHDYTGRLPLLCNTSDINLIGNTTEESMWSGVVNGMKAEILGLLAQYKSQYPRLTTFVTGGDAYLFDIDAKNYIFVNENLTLLGLNLILEHNAK